MGLLTILNLILVLLASFAIIILFIRQNQLLHLEKKYQQLNEELEETIANFFIQMKEENERFLEKFQQVQKSDIKRATSINNNEQGLRKKIKQNTKYVRD